MFFFIWNVLNYLDYPNNQNKEHQEKFFNLILTAEAPTWVTHF